MYTGAEVQQKWLNLRTCFSRELKAQKTTSGQAAKKRRKYRYFEKLLFLKSSLAERPTDGNLDSTAAEDEDETETSDNMSSNVPIRQNTRNKKVNSGPKFEESLLNILKDDLDEDKHFALSLVPTLQSMTDDEKFQAKIEILQVCRRIKANRQHTQSSVTLPSRNIFLQPSQFHEPSTNNLLQPSRNTSLQHSPNNLVQQISQQPGYYTGSTTPHIDASRPEYIRQCPSTSSQHSEDSLQSYISNFTPSPHSPLLDLN